MELSMFKPIRIARASEAIVDQIEEHIFQGTLKPGNRLPPERELAQQFGVSRITIRDALRSLESRGFIEIRVGAGGGAFVKQANSDTVGETLYDMVRRHRITLAELIEARSFLEPAIAELAARKATPDDLVALRQAIAQAEQALGVHPFMPSSLAFHIALATASHNAVMASTVYALRTALYAALDQLRQPVAEIPQVAIREHLEILRAVEAHDAARARQLMYDHLAYFEQHLREVLGPAIDRPLFEPDELASRDPREQDGGAVPFDGPAGDANG
jgi:GntR family transcriptional repressor for pyruvate dehydrogenase complex